MIICKASGVYDGTRYSDYIHPKDIRVRINEWKTVDMHIQHPNAGVLSDPLELTQEQVASLASVLASLDRSLRGVHGDSSESEWEGDPEWQWREAEGKE